MGAAGETNAGEQILSALTNVAALTTQLSGEQHVLFRRKSRHEVIGLKNEANFAAANPREVVFTQALYLDAVHGDPPRGYGIESGKKTEEGALAAAGGTHDGNKLPARNGEVHVAQNVHVAGTVIDAFEELLDLDDIGRLFGGVHVNLRIVKGRRSSLFIVAAMAAWTVILGGCGSTNKVSVQEKRAPAPLNSSAAPTPSTERRDARPLIVAFGDSLTAGVAGQSYPEDLQDLLDQDGLKFRVENQGVSGDTTTDGLARIENVIAEKPALVLLEFGGNDGLRGIPVEATRRNLSEMIERLRAANIPIVLLGITLPPNYGPDYVKPFTAMFPELAKQYHLTYLPFLLIHVYQHGNLMQPDGIHPNGEGNKVVAQDVLALIKPMLLKKGKRAGAA